MSCDCGWRKFIGPAELDVSLSSLNLAASRHHLQQHTGVPSEPYLVAPQAQVEALTRMLTDSGDLTPTGARMVLQTLRGEQQ
jgi:hypothetical protein